MCKFTSCLLILSAICGAQQKNHINRLVTTVNNASVGVHMIAFTDAETGDTVRYKLPIGMLPGSLVAMDRRGDVWLNDRNSLALRKFSGVDGRILVVINPANIATYLVTDRDGSLLVASSNNLAGPQAAVFVDRYTSDGMHVAQVDLRTLFPPGALVALTATWSTIQNPFQGPHRMLVTRTGSIWLAIQNAAHNPIIRLNSDLTLGGSYGLYSPLALVPDDDDGAWVFYNNAGLAPTYPLNAPPMPGVPPLAWVHLSGTGQVLTTWVDGAAGGTGLVPTLGQRRFDGRQFQYCAPGATSAPPRIYVHTPTSTATQMFPIGEAIDLFGMGLSAELAGFHLDGAQRLWALQALLSGGPVAFNRWLRFPVDPPYGNYLLTVPGESPMLVPWFNLSYFMASYWGNASLFEFVHYTDPFGDLDEDGVANHVELANFSNPLLPFGFSPAPSATATGGAPGTTLTVTYRVPTDQGLSYWAPFGLAPAANHTLGGGYFLPLSPADPLVQLSLSPNVPGITGTQGTIDAQEQATATLSIPPVPALSGLTLTTFIATRDPNLPLLLKTVSRPFSFTLP
jgi:hypothetical protein